MANRTRSQSAREEKLVSGFVDATVNFKSNVTFVSELPSKTGIALAARVLVLLPEKVETAVKPTFWNDELEAALAEATPNALYATTAAINGNRTRVMLAVVPATASRHNCALRPDTIVTLTLAAVGTAPAKQPLDVVVALPIEQDQAQIIAQAIAKGANRSFSAKAGNAEADYFNAGVQVRVAFAGATVAKTETENKKLGDLATGVQLAMRLGDAPPCLLDTVTFAEIAKKYAAALGFEFSEIRGEELREKGYGGVYGVGKAAEYPPALVTLTYKPKLGEGIQPKDKIAFVGKGIVYDTGGLSIKTPTTFMCGMKMDMCGAGAVFSGFLTLVRMGSPYEINAVLCLADNAVGPRAQRPDDILLLKSGVSIEVANTDAEGRLVLADGVYHACNEIPGFTPSLVVDMATLTGAQLVATGKKHAAIFTTSEEWETKFVASGKKSGDVCFPIVYCPEFHNPQYDSKVADYKNLPLPNDAPSSCAGMFMTNNLGKNYKGEHLHVDLAGPAMGVEVATGYGVALLASVFGQ